MRVKLLRHFVPSMIGLSLIFLSGIAHAQNFAFSCTKDTTVPGCSAAPCFTFKARIPDIYGAASNNYVVNPISTSTCFPVYMQPTDPGTSTNIFVDDTYTPPIDIGFPFTFFGNQYTQLVASTNGTISFDISKAGQFAHWNIINGTVPQNLPSTFYDKLLIMGPYHDLNPEAGTSPKQLIQYSLIGTAPTRKWILSFYKVPLYGNNGSGCDQLIENTHQIVLNEGTGIIEVLIFSQQICTSWNQGRAMVGLQNGTRTLGVMAPGRRASDPPWGSVDMNEGWRFVPTGGFSLFKRVELYDLSGTLIGTGTTANAGGGFLEATFAPDICPPGGLTTSYVIKSVYQKNDDPSAEVFGYDTVRVTKGAPSELNATATTTPTGCGPGTGSITVNVPAGSGDPATMQFALGAAPFQSSNVFTNLAQGNYFVHVKDGNGCSSNFRIDVGQVSNLVAIADPTATSCSGAANGTITISATPTPIMAPISYLLDGATIPVPVASLPYTIPGVSAGIHSIVINEGSGCSATVNNINVAAGPGINGTSTTTPTSCPGATNGSITVTTTSPAGPYTFQLDGGPILPGAKPYTFSNVSTGLHTVIITDGSGCNVSLPINVPAGPALNATTTFIATSCAGASNGSITITPTNGAAPYTFSIDGGPLVAGTSPYTFTNLPAGLHSVMFADAGSCQSATLPVVITAGAGLTATVTTVATSCTGATNGNFTLVPTNGNTPYSFSVDGGAFLPKTAPYTFSNLAAGLHTVSFTDGASCQSSVINVNIAAGPGLTSTLSGLTATSCTGAINGSFNLTPTNGNAPYAFSLDGGGFIPKTTPYLFSNIAAGPHTVVVADGAGCQSTPVSVTIVAGPALTATSTITATSCTGAVNGSFNLTPTNGNGPYTFSLDGAAFIPKTSPYLFSNLTAGPHTVTLADGAGCQSAVIPIVIPAGPALNASTTITPTSCQGAPNGSFVVTPSNGNTPFTFSLDGGAFAAATAPYTFSNLIAGPHTITIADGAGCQSAPITVAIPAGPGLTTTVAKTNILCNGNTNGTITVTQPALGTPPFSYSLDGVTWQASTLFSGLVANTYTVYYREANGCQGSQRVTITEPLVLTATVTPTAVVCNGQNNGKITINAGGGTTPYQYSIDGGTTWQSTSTYNVIVGSYSILIKDASNCTVTKPVVITEPALLTATAVTTNATCNGGTDGTITVTATGGNSSYQYSSDGITFQASNILNVRDGSFTVTVKDNLGCNYSFPVTVGLTNTLTITHQTLDPTICEGKSAQLVAVSNATQFAWRPSAKVDQPTIANPLASPSVTTEYIVGLTLGNCYGEDTTIVNVNPAPLANAGAAGDICYGQTYQLQGSGGVSYTWAPSTYLDDPAIANPISSPLRTITYSLSVVDALGCNSLADANVIVNVVPPIQVITSPADTVAAPGEQFQIQASAQLQITNTAPTYTWTPAAGLSNAGIPNPIVTVGAIGDDVIYKVTATTVAGCKGEGFVHVKVYKGPDIYMPSGFTPNGDGRNDKFTPFPVGIRQINYFRVFNRNGQLMFFTSRLNDGWDGKLGGIEQPSGVYVWMVQGITKDNNVITKKGTVVIIR